MEAKHTPGPWKIWEHGTETDPSCKIWAGNEGVAQTLGGNDEANARLIAAAPNLLEACEYTRDLLGSGIGQSTHALAMIEAAIAKAEKGE